MALSDKNIVITPAISSSSDPKIVFSGADASTGPQNITITAYPANGGTLSIDGSAGQLFSVSNSLTGTLFAVNDISGVPSIEVLDTGVVKLAQYNGSVMIGGGTNTGTLVSGTNLWMNGTSNAALGNRLWMDSYLGTTNWLNVRTANGTLAAPTALTAGMQIFGISTGGYGTTGYISAGTARITMNAEATWTDTSAPTYIAFQTTPVAATGASERVRIDSNGVLMINRTALISGISSSCRLQVLGTNGEWTAGLENNAATTPFGLAVRYSAASPNGVGSQFFLGMDSTTTRVELRSNGGLANFSANNVNLSDERLKKDITPAGSYWEKVKNIEVVTYLYKDQTDEELNLGVIAQQLDAVAPELVSHDGFGETPEGESPYLSVYQTDLQYATLKALQEAMTKIEQMQAQIDLLEARLT